MNNNEIIEKLKEAIETKDSNCISKAIKESGIIDKLKYTVTKDCQAPLFRVRPHSTADDYPYTNVDHFSYNPMPKKGRCNLDGEALLYTSLESKTAVFEMIRADHSGRNIWLSFWLPKNPMKCFVFLFDESEIQDEYTRSMHQDIVDNLKVLDPEFDKNLELYRWISEQFFVGNYDFSSQLCSELFKAHDIDGILYPSYAGSSHGLNLVIRKEFADEHIDFQCILSLKIEKWEFPFAVKYLLLGEAMKNEIRNLEWFNCLSNDNERGRYIIERRLREELNKIHKIDFSHDFFMSLSE